MFSALRHILVEVKSYFGGVVVGVLLKQRLDIPWTRIASAEDTLPVSNFSNQRGAHYCRKSILRLGMPWYLIWQHTIFVLIKIVHRN
jgi:hypothetical protein